MDNVVVGKRIQVGAVITSIAAIFAHFDPDNAAAYVGATVPLTFAVQVWIANRFGVTTK